MITVLGNANIDQITSEIVGFTRMQFRSRFLSTLTIFLKEKLVLVAMMQSCVRIYLFSLHGEKKCADASVILKRKSDTPGKA